MILFLFVILEFTYYSLKIFYCFLLQNVETFESIYRIHAIKYKNSVRNNFRFDRKIVKAFLGFAKLVINLLSVDCSIIMGVKHLFLFGIGILRLSKKLLLSLCLLINSFLMIFIMHNLYFYWKSLISKN